MKGDKNSRRKSTNNLRENPNASHHRMVGQPYEQPVPRPKKETNQGAKSNVIGAKQLATSDHLKIDKHRKDFATGAKIVSAKNRIPRFSSEQTKERYVVVPSLWHKVEERAIKNHSSKITLTQLKGSKRSKMLDGSLVRVDSQTPHVIQRNASEKIDLELNKKDSVATAGNILAHSTTKQKRFKRQRSNSSDCSRNQQKQELQQKTFIDSQSHSLDIQNQSLLKIRSDQVNETTGETTDSQYVLQKPVALNQPKLSKPNSKVPVSAVQGCAMLQLLTNTTIHLQSEAERLSKETHAVQTSKQPQSQMLTASRKSRDSNKYLLKNGIKSERGLHQDYQKQSTAVPLASAQQTKTDQLALVAEPDSASFFKDNLTGGARGQATQKQKSQKAATTDFRSQESIQFRSKYPSTRIKIDEQKQHMKQGTHMQAQRKSDLDSMASQHQLKSVTQKMPTSKVNIKRKPVSALDEDFDRLYQAPNTTAGHSSKQQISVTTTGSSHPKSVAMSMNSIRADNRITHMSDTEGGDYLRRQKEQVERLTMPQIAQTPHISLSTKYSQQNASKLSSTKQKQFQQASQTVKLNPKKTALPASQESKQQASVDLQQQAVNSEISKKRVPDQSHYTMQSPSNSINQERRQLFDHGRASRTKTVKTYYPALTNGLCSSSKINSEQEAITAQSESEKKIQMPQLQSKPASSIQNSNHDTILSSQKDSASIIGATTHFSHSMNTMNQSYNPPVYKTAAPKFIPARSIKMQQAKAYNQKIQSTTAANSASIRNLHEKRQMSYSNIGQVGMAFKRQLGNHRAVYTMGPNGRPILSRPRHVLHCSTSSEEQSSQEEEQEEIAGDRKKNNHASKLQQEQEEAIQDQEILPHKPDDDDVLQQVNLDTDQGVGADIEQDQQQVKSEDATESEQQPKQQEQTNFDDLAKTDLKDNNDTKSLGGLPPIQNSNVIETTDIRRSSHLTQTGKKNETKKRHKKYKMPRLVFNLMYTQYPIIKKVAKSLNFRARTDDIQLVPPPPGTEEYYLRQSGHMPQGPLPDFDISWMDNPVAPEVLSKIKQYQRISQFPGISVISNKKKLASGLMKMYKRFPEEFDFFPQTYVLPVEYTEFKAQFEKYGRQMNGASAKKQSSSGGETFIIKPENLCQGRGIYLVKDPREVDPADNCVAQKYITNPFLLDDLKFDLRLYVLVYGVNPLRIFLFKDGLVRLATEPYVKPTDANIDNLFMHLTNYAINKNNDNFVQNAAADSDDDLDDDGTHKRSLKSFIYTLKCMGKPYKKLRQDINDILVKTMIVAQPSLSHLYKSCQPDDLENQLCFQILGFDILIDEDCKPWLIEVNQSPSFKADSGLDKRIKTQLVTDTVNLLNLNARRKQKWIHENKKVMQKRMLTGKKAKLTQEEREEKIAAKQSDRDLYEKANLGKFKLIYPCQDPDQMETYEKLLQASYENWEDLTTGRRRKNPATNQTIVNNRSSAAADGQEPSVDVNGKQIWKGSGSVQNYMPAWERNFQKSLQQKAARLSSLQQQNSGEPQNNQNDDINNHNNQQQVVAPLSQRQTEPMSARSAATKQSSSNPCRQSQAA